MPNLPISGLPASSTLQGDELFADVQDGVTKYTTLDDISAFAVSTSSAIKFNEFPSKKNYGSTYFLVSTV